MRIQAVGDSEGTAGGGLSKKAMRYSATVIRSIASSRSLGRCHFKVWQARRGGWHRPEQRADEGTAEIRTSLPLIMGEGGKASRNRSEPDFFMRSAAGRGGGDGERERRCCSGGREMRWTPTTSLSPLLYLICSRWRGTGGEPSCDLEVCRSSRADGRPPIR